MADLGIKISAVDNTGGGFSSAINGLERLQTATDSAQNGFSKIGDRINLVGAAAGLSISALAVGFLASAKAAIDAADSMNDLSQRVGIAVNELAKYELATSQSGTSMESLAKGMKGLSGNMLEHGDALKHLGINATTTDAAMQQFADVFAKMPDGMEKTTLAVKVFGKSGMDLIPMLNLGSEGLEKAAEKSAKYAAVMASMAPLSDAFNDNVAELGMLSKLTAMSLANDLLPALINISQTFIDAKQNGASFFGTIDAGIWAFENEMSKRLPSMFESYATAMPRQIAGLKQELIDLQKESDRIHFDPFGQKDKIAAESAIVVKALSDAENAYKKYLGTTTGGAGRGSVNPTFAKTENNWQAEYQSMMDALKEGKPSSGAADKISEYTRLGDEMRKTAALAQAEIDASAALTKSDEFRVSTLEKLIAEYQNGKITIAEYIDLESRMNDAEGTVAQAEAKKKVAKANLDAAEAHQKYITSLAGSLDKIKADSLAQQESNDRLGLGKEAIAALDAAKLESQAVTLELLAIKTLDKNLDEVQYNLYKAQAAELRNLAALKGQGAVKEVNLKDSADQLADWKKSVEKYDDIFRNGFSGMLNGGQGAWKSFTTSLTTTFKTSVADQLYKMFAQPFVMKIVASLIGVTGSAAAGLASAADLGGASDALNGLSIASSLSNLSSTIGAGFQALTGSLAGAGTASLGYANAVGAVGGDSIGALAAANGNWAGVSTMGSAGEVGMLGTAQGAGSGVASTAGTLGYAAGGVVIGSLIAGDKVIFGMDGTTSSAVGAAAGAAIGTYVFPVIGTAVGALVGGIIGGVVNAAFGHGSTEMQSSGVRGTLLNTGFSGQSYANMHQDGGWFSSDNNWTETRGVSSEISKSLDVAFAGTKISVANLAVSLGLSTDKIAAYSKYIDIAAGTSNESITAMFTSMADEMALATAPALNVMAKSGEAASVTLARLSGSLITSNAWLSMLNQRLHQVSLAGGDAASKLADAFGGLDKLTASSKAFYETYYTEGERSARSQEDMAKALALVNLALPDSKDSLKALAATLDLNSEAGRQAYAVLLAIAPEFAATADNIAKLASEASAALMKTFTGNGRLIPALDAAALKISDFTGASTTMAGELSYINTIMGDSTSAVISFSDGAYVLGTNLSDSQKSAGLLASQIADLKDAADKARIDFVGLSAALANVNTETFVSTIGLAFDNLAARISGVLDAISSERMAVRDAALQIINPTVLGKAQIQAGIAGVNTALPSNTAAVTANKFLDFAITSQKNAQSTVSWLQGMQSTFVSASTTRDNAGSVYSDAWKAKGDAGSTAELAVFNTAQSAYLVALSNWVTYSKYLPQAVTDLANSNSYLTQMTDAAKMAALNYAAAMQTFAIDASKSVTKLTKLREETVKYYEAQKALADLMTNSAAGLRKTVADYNYSQMTPEAQLANLQGQFSQAYSMAQASQGDGATLASYGDQLNTLLGPLIDKLGETGNGNLVGSYLAQAESVAALIDKAIPVNYQADSLAMLSSIDVTLAALDASSQSAEKIISAAVTAGSDRTAAGLRALGEAITGKAIPAFAAGGYHAGGLRKVGENGPEWEVTGPSLIFNSSQTRTRSMGGQGGNTERLEALVERQAQQLEAMSYELRAIAVSTGKVAKTLDRVTPDGNSLQMVVAA